MTEESDDKREGSGEMRERMRKERGRRGAISHC